MDGGSAQQQATASGDGAVVNQTVGDNNVVTIFAGGSRMVLDRPHKRRREPTTELELLQTDVRATRLVGRDPEVKALKDWLAQDAAVAVRCLIGRAGSGKSRLAIELCEAAEADEWIAGFVDSDELARFHAQMNLGASQPVKQTLVVVDDAASAGRILKDWFATLARQVPTAGAGKLRVLMLERHADEEFGWWAELKRIDDMARAGAASIIGQEQPVSLSVLAAATDRRALLEDAMALAARLKGVSVPALPPRGENAQFDAVLDNDSRLENEPIFLMMAAIVGAERGVPGALASGKPELAKKIAGNERGRITRLAEAHGLSDRVGELLHAAACITLQRGSPPEALMDMLEKEAAAMRFGQPSDAMADLLLEAMPTRDGFVDGIRPDLIGGAFMVDILKGGPRRSPAQVHAIVARAQARADLPVVETLILAAQDLAEGSADFPAVQWLLAVAREEPNADRLAETIDSLPQNSLALREAAADLQQRLTDFRRQEENPVALAMSLNNLANRQSDLGRREAALATAEEAVMLYRQLAAARPDAFLPNLAASLNNLACFQSDLGGREAALATAEEAVVLYRQLAAARPDAFLPNLAVSLNTLANRQSDLGRREAALATAEEAVMLRRQLAAARPDAFLPNFARSLSVYAAILEGQDALGIACDRDREAVATLSEPFMKLPAAHASLMNTILKDYVRRHEAAGQQPDADLLNPIIEVLTRMNRGGGMT